MDDELECKKLESSYVRVYTDGACSRLPFGDGGWAWAVDRSVDSWFSGDLWQRSGSATGTTNQRMELFAAYDALRYFQSNVEIVSDSAYIVNCFRDEWYKNWIATDFRSAGRRPIANRDLWEPFLSLYLVNKELIKFTWVKGHSGHPMNDRVDELAVAAKKRIQVERNV
jgi:ribonuclease HI